jgi:hypothetical protein
MGEAVNPENRPGIRALLQELEGLYRQRAVANNRLQEHLQLYGFSPPSMFLRPLDDVTAELAQALGPIDHIIQKVIDALGELGPLIQPPPVETQTAELVRALLEREWTNDGVESTCRCGAVRGLAWFPRGKEQSPYGDGFSGCATTQSPYLMHAPTCIFQWLHPAPVFPSG